MAAGLSEDMCVQSWSAENNHMMLMTPTDVGSEGRQRACNLARTQSHGHASAVEPKRQLAAISVARCTGQGAVFFDACVQQKH